MFSLLSKICRVSRQTLKIIRPRRSMLTFTVFLVLSGLFWLSTALNEYSDCEVKIPLFIENIPKNVVITSEIEDTLKVVVHDKGFTLLQYLYGKKIRPISINLSTVPRLSDKYILNSSELLRIVRKQFYNSTTVTSVNPERIEVGYFHGTGKSVAVRLDGDIVPSPDYYLAHTRIMPDRVTVYASKNVLDEITHVMTEKLHIYNFSDTLSKTVSLKAIKGARIKPQKVTITLFPDILTEEVVDVPINIVNLPEGVNVRTFPSRVKVKFNVGVSQYRNVNTARFRVEVDYKSINLNTDKCPLRITQMPKEVTKASLEFNEVDYLIEN
jgi:hypothetical protein